MRALISKESVFYLRKNNEEDIEDYLEDFKTVIRQRESTRLPFSHASPQSSIRPCLVEYLKRVSVEKCLSHCCLHLAVYLLDIFMDNHSVITGRVLLVANVCILLAAKLDENALTTPKMAELNALVNHKYSLQDYKHMEIMILGFFNYTIMFPTAAHYIFYYIEESLGHDDLCQTNRNFRTLFYDFYHTVTLYLDKIIDDVHYMQCYRPSLLAAAVIAVSREEEGLSRWTQHLEGLTEYTDEELQPLVNLLKIGCSALNCLKCWSPN